ncbi:MAG: penicillin-binding protein activator LpoB [Gammaproteobacteria bacterium]
MIKNNIRRSLKGLLLLTMVAALGACATKVERISPDQVRDLSGEWNDTDSQLVSKEMISDALSQAWLGNFQRAHSKQPAVIVGEVRNLSHEHINVNTFVSDIERALINSGKVEFVASKEQRQEIREERKDQDINAREDTRKAMGRELGADFMLKGQINTILDTEGKRQVRYYQVDLSLISLADNRIVWVGQKKIKKFVTKASLRF